jgi:hypothetical protein
MSSSGNSYLPLSIRKLIFIEKRVFGEYIKTNDEAIRRISNLDFGYNQTQINNWHFNIVDNCYTWTKNHD